MRYLLDTHVFIWVWEGNRRIKADVRRILKSEDIFVSVVSAWEVTIKTSLGKLRLPGPFEEAIELSGYERLNLDFRHVRFLDGLPPHHGDPFDRVLIAQAQAEDMILLTADARLGDYGAHVRLID